jgi:hypothetical protein
MSGISVNCKDRAPIIFILGRRLARIWLITQDNKDN